MNFIAEAKHRNVSNLRVPFLGGHLPAMQMEIDTPRVILAEIYEFFIMQLGCELSCIFL